MAIGTDVDGNRMIVMGEGDIGVCTAKTPDNERANEIVFLQSTKNPIGKERPEQIGESTSNHKNCVRLQFLNVDALDVLVHQLVILRAEMAWSITTKESEAPLS